jgi:hypothetical protein
MSGAKHILVMWFVWKFLYAARLRQIMSRLHHVGWQELMAPILVLPVLCGAKQKVAMMFV